MSIQCIGRNTWNRLWQPYPLKDWEPTSQGLRQRTQLAGILLTNDLTSDGGPAPFWIKNGCLRFYATWCTTTGPRQQRQPNYVKMRSDRKAASKVSTLHACGCSGVLDHHRHPRIHYMPILSFSVSQFTLLSFHCSDIPKLDILVCLFISSTNEGFILKIACVYCIRAYWFVLPDLASRRRSLDILELVDTFPRYWGAWWHDTVPRYYWSQEMELEWGPPIGLFLPATTMAKLTEMVSCPCHI